MKPRFHCLFCKGFEERDGDSAAVLAAGNLLEVPQVLHVARQASALASSVTIYTNGSESLANDLKAHMGKAGGVMSVDTRRIQAFSLPVTSAEHRGVGIVVSFDDGTKKMESFVAHRPAIKLRGDFVEQFGIELTASGDIKTTPFGESSVAGIFVAGDLCSPLKSVPSAILSGNMAGGGASAQILEEKFGQKGLFG